MVSLANICLADGQVDDIVRWTEPSDAFGQKYSTVTYKFSGTRLIPDLPAEAAATVRAPQETTITLVRTNDGWQPPSK
ncbi:hypothetical protein EAH79_00765 [Sphingomonas koreensis]|nr:hypothetical protein EAH79_00765 [Sphingomonas koreensis]